MTKLYKAKHKRTGLFFVPSRSIKIDGEYKKCNLSKKGKVYQYTPQYTWFTTIYNEKGIIERTAKEDWEYVVVGQMD